MVGFISDNVVQVGRGTAQVVAMMPVAELRQAEYRACVGNFWKSEGNSSGCTAADANSSIIHRLQGHCQGDDPWCARRVRMP
jgi:hypothetical protein